VEHCCFSEKLAFHRLAGNPSLAGRLLKQLRVRETKRIFYDQFRAACHQFLTSQALVGAN
jgi:hypothetical protein